MHNTSKAVSPFYDQEPGAPPPFPPMLTDQLELFGGTHHSTTLIADEILPPRVSTIVPLNLQLRTMLASESKLVPRSSKNTDRSLPYPKRVSRVSFRSRTSAPSTPSDPSGSFDLVSDGGSSTPIVSEDSKIPKPHGEPGRPGRGGYTLQEALDWSTKTYAKFKKCVHHLIDEHLDVTKCTSSQSPALLGIVRNKVSILSILTAAILDSDVQGPASGREPSLTEPT
ncbi:hypothetical protein K503DRAFT_805530 [Rhizopogon vinicolor AM-OR11-026]|uniref:Uncharacterized protein n=1 Tax=Rhizopogon vinicolor AM-OR11-026 TaxID=1314800 RepID=A0A1B7MHL2_9AGAM|nr:hypothetical protein K503DRAFT_805530 [Rhizopogon vinicolor AM-OR11-026]